MVVVEAAAVGVDVGGVYVVVVVVVGSEVFLNGGGISEERNLLWKSLVSLCVMDHVDVVDVVVVECGLVSVRVRQ